jgi:tetratricopeptide (TPR) repeat protein
MILLAGASEEEPCFLFVNSENRQRQTKKTCKDWSPGERAQVVKSFNTLQCKAADLVKLASSNKPIKLRRATHITEDPDGFGRVTVQSAAAMAENDTIYFADDYFASDTQTHNLAHELVHLADADSHFSCDPRWIAFSSPVISDIRRKTENLSQPNLKEYQRLLREKKIWPSIYGTLNYEEALAEFVANRYLSSSYDASDQPSPAKIGFIFSPKNVEINNLIREAHLRSTNENYLGAIDSLNRALLLSPDMPVVHRDLAFTYDKLGKLKQAMDQIDLAIDGYENVGVTCADTSLQTLLEYAADESDLLGDRDSATAYLRRLEKEAPFNWFIAQKIILHVAKRNGL